MVYPRLTVPNTIRHPILFFDYLSLSLTHITLAIPLQELVDGWCQQKERGANGVSESANHLLLLRGTQFGNALLLRSALCREFSVSCLLPCFPLRLVLECLGKGFTRFLYLAFSLRAEVDLFESINEAEHGGYKPGGDGSVRLFGGSQGKNNSLCSVRGKDGGTDTGLIRDLRVYRLKKCTTGTTKGEEEERNEPKESGNRAGSWGLSALLGPALRS